MSIVEILTEIRKTNVTNTIHKEPYDDISPTRSELSQVGRSILITGGGTGAGFAMAQAFIRASASTIIIVGRRTEVLDSARLKLEDEVKSLGTGARIIARPCDGTKASDIDALWQYLSDENIFVDVYIANAAKFTEPVPMMELGSEEVWSQIETNVWSPLYFTEKFCKQPGDKQKVSDYFPPVEDS
jgi:NAD(P)-dependent dehydrogenase (short-subunit alcohol dehydrogenase family)